MDTCNFGVEIEVIVEPHTVRDPLQPEVYYGKLEAALRKRGLKALADTLKERYQKHPEHYNKWWITKDGSLGKPSHPGIAMEAVSPKFRSLQQWEDDIDTFWQAMSAVFHMPIRSSKCGSHVHVSSSRGYTLNDAKRIAYGVVRYEKQVQQILPASRRDNKYSQRNSKNSKTLSKTGSLGSRAAAIQRCKSLSSLEQVMQEERRVLWNFANITTSGTVEFRGGRGLRGPVRTKRWIAFAVGFIELSLQKSERDFLDAMDNLYDFGDDYDDEDPITVDEFYDDLKDAAGKHYMSIQLPTEYRVMNESLSEYDLGAEADSAYYPDTDSDASSIISKGASIDSDTSSDMSSTYSKEAPWTSSDVRYSFERDYISSPPRSRSRCIIL